MTTYYRVDVEDPLFNPLVKIEDYLDLDLTDTANNVGPLVLQVPIAYLNAPFDIYKPDLVLAIMESTDGSPWRLHRNTKWFVETISIQLDSNKFFLEIRASDALTFLVRRANPYYAGSSSTGYPGQAQSQLNGTYADNMIKSIIRNNLGATATDYTLAAGVITTRQLPPSLFAVDPDTSEGAVVGDKGIAWRQSLLAPCQELAQVSYENGVYLTFDVVMSGGKLTFRTFPRLRGRDHSAASGQQPITLTPENGLSKAELIMDYSQEVNAVYCAGQGEGNARIVQKAIDVARATLNPWGYRESFVDARNGGTTAASVLGEAQAALRAGQPLLQLSGSMTETPRLRYGMDGEIFFGDLVPVSFMGYQFICRLEQVNIKVTAGQPAVPTINFRSI